MTCSTCPNCGFDLEQLEQLTLGYLDILHGGAIIRWKGKMIGLTPTETLMVCAIARAGGAIVSNEALASVSGYDGDKAPGINAVRLCRIKKAFRRVDPGFDMLDTGQLPSRAPGRDGRRHRGGARWRIEA